ncbi:MAG: hypothetical protein HYU88_04540 [Chloroflexi bacterium]|nr:hypothetical protein [Chloroflexota bacterium]
MALDARLSALRRLIDRLAAVAASQVNGHGPAAQPFGSDRACAGRTAAGRLGRLAEHGLGCGSGGRANER